MRYTLARKPGGGQMFGWAETELAANAELAWRVECPFGVTVNFKEAIKAAGKEMGIILGVEEHAFPPVALEDTASAYKIKAPIKGSREENRRKADTQGSLHPHQDRRWDHPPL